MIGSGGSRISRRWGGVDLRHGRFLVKMYVKTKELGPVGGGRAPGTPPPPLDPPMVGKLHRTELHVRFEQILFR